MAATHIHSGDSSTCIAANRIISSVTTTTDENGPRIVETIASSCTSGDCPTVYRTDRGTLIVQGYDVDAGSAGVALPQGENLVEIPVELLASALEQVG